MKSRGLPPRGAQSSLPGMEHPVATDRLFLALFPDRPALARIEQVARELPPDLRPPASASRSSRFHVTLHHLGDYAGLEPALVDSALAAVALVSTPSFDIVMDHVSSFRGGRRHPVVLRCPDESLGVRRLWDDSRMELARTPFSRWLEGKFVPHLTLAYGDRMLPEPVGVEPIVWTVGEVVLVHSLLGRSAYRVLGNRRLSPS